MNQKNIAKHISCEFKCKFDSRKCNSNQKWNKNKRWYACRNTKKHHMCDKDDVWNPSTCTCENGKYLESITDNSVITCD